MFEKKERERERERERNKLKFNKLMKQTFCLVTYYIDTKKFLLPFS